MDQRDAKIYVQCSQMYERIFVINCLSLKALISEIIYKILVCTFLVNE